MKRRALQESIDAQSHWFCRMAALFCLATFPLTGEDLAQITRIIHTEAHPQLLRAAYVTLCQHAGNELHWVLDRVTLFNAPHQDYFRRYFLQLYENLDAGKRLLSRIKGASVRAPTFIQNLHQLDLLKACDNKEQRAVFNEVINVKILDCEGEQWPRLTRRLSQIHDSFVLNP